MTVWNAPAADIPMRATVAVPHLGDADRRVSAATVADAAVFLAAAATTTGTVVITNWSEMADDPSARMLRECLASMGTYVVRSAEGLTCTSRSTSGHLAGITADLGAHRGIVGPLVALALVADDVSTFTGLAPHAALIEALLADVQALGGLAEWDGDTLRVFPQPLHAGAWRGGGDPAVAALGAVLALTVPGVVVADGLDPDSPDGHAFVDVWAEAMAADEHILPGATRGTVPFYR